MRSNQQSKDWQNLLTCFLGSDFLQDFESINRPLTPYSDVYVTKNEVMAVVDLPGVENINEIKIEVSGTKLMLSGKLTSPYQGYEQFSSERSRGSFRKEIILPMQVNKSKHTARYDKGVLELRFLKKQHQPF